MEVLAEGLLPYAVTSAELKLLPQACSARFGEDKAAKGFWEQKIGRDNFLHLHHYCFGLNFINRAKFAIDKKNKVYYLNLAVGNFDYVLRHWPANSPLRPEAEAGKREAQLMIKTL